MHARALRAPPDPELVLKFSTKCSLKSIYPIYPYVLVPPDAMRDRGRRDQGRLFANSKVPVVLPNITKIISVPGRY